MNPISGVLNSINTSLLSEIASFNSTTAASGTTSTALPSPSTSSAPSSDRVDFSSRAELFKELKQLQVTNPDEFKQVMTDAAKKLTDAASQQTDPQAAQFLTDLASRFQKAADTGDLSALKPSQSADAAQGTSHAHHHHHHHAAQSSTSDSDSDDATSKAASAYQSPTSGGGLAGLLMSALGVNQASQSSNDIEQMLSTLMSSQS